QSTNLGFRLPAFDFHQHAADAVQQQVKIQWFLEVIGHTGTQRLNNVGLVGIAGKYDGFEHPVPAGSTSKCLEQLEPVHFRHAKITQHQYHVLMGLELADGVVGAVRSQACEPLADEKLDQLLDYQRLVVNHQNRAVELI